MSDAIPRISSLLLNISLTSPTFINAENSAKNDHGDENVSISAGRRRLDHHDIAAALVRL
jgi:hypothetical protein